MKANWHNESILAALRIQLTGNVEKASEILVAGMKEMLSQPGHGRIYKRGGRTHQASAPGEPPAVDYGDLRNSVAVQARRRERLSVQNDVGSKVKHAWYTEFGTGRRGASSALIQKPPAKYQHGPKEKGTMHARPWMWRTVVEKRQEVQAALTQGLGGARTALLSSEKGETVTVGGEK